MKISRTGNDAFTVEFETEAELREEHRANLSVGGLRLPEPLPLHSAVNVTLRGPWGGETDVRATVVAPLPDGAAAAISCDPDELLAKLLAREEEKAEASESPDSAERSQTVSDRIRGLNQVEKILLATKADRVERAFLLQDTDPRILLSLLRNPRITIEEIARLSKSTHMTYQIADVILKTSQWIGSLDVRLALIHNPKTPPPFALRILATLPDNEVRVISRGAATSMALKQAALRRLQGGS
jgi:hypothetical protein